MKVKSESHSVTSDSLQPHGLYSPWNSPGQNTGVGSLSLLQGIFLTQGSCIAGRFFIYQLSHKGSPRILEWVAYPFSSRSSWLRNWTGVSCIAGGFFTNWALREAHPIRQWEQNQEASWYSRPCPRGYRPQSLQGQGRHSHGLACRASIGPRAHSWQRLGVWNLGSDHPWLLSWCEDPFPTPPPRPPQNSSPRSSRWQAGADPPCPRWPASWPRSPRTARPTPRPWPWPPPLAPASAPPGQTCSPRQAVGFYLLQL